MYKMNRTLIVPGVLALLLTLPPIASAATPPETPGQSIIFNEGTDTTTTIDVKTTTDIQYCYDGVTYVIGVTTVSTTTTKTLRRVFFHPAGFAISATGQVDRITFYIPARKLGNVKIMWKINFHP